VQSLEDPDQSYLDVKVLAGADGASGLQQARDEMFERGLE
jgi:hypothetical protein